MIKRISPDFFSVAPQLIGLPLASPTRRAVAMLIDLILIGFLAALGGGVFLGLAAFFVLLSAARRNQSGGVFRKSVRLTLRIAAAAMLFVVITRIWNVGEQKIEDITHSAAELNAQGGAQFDMQLRDLPELMTAGTGMAAATDTAQITEHTRALLRRMKERGATTVQLRSMRGSLIDMLAENTDSSTIAAVERGIASVAPPVTEPDSFRAIIAGLEVQRDTLAERLDRATEQKRGIRAFLSSLLDDLGVGFGWAAVFFTAFLALMRGQTPGKRLLKIRVIRLDGKPLGWWMAFERFGGYAASLILGLLGFMQILWDRNRQGLHDKACETVVIYDAGQLISPS